MVDGRVEMIPEVGTALRVFSEAGLMAGTFDEELGGMQTHVVARAAMAWFHPANVGTAAYPVLAMACARLLLAHGPRELAVRFVRPVLEGRWFGTMALSESQAGSSLADITTRAEPRTTAPTG